MDLQRSRYRVSKGGASQFVRRYIHSLFPIFPAPPPFQSHQVPSVRIWRDRIRQISILSLFRLVFKLQDAIIKYKQYV